MSAEEMTIRRATMGDVAAMAAVGVAAWRPFYAKRGWRDHPQRRIDTRLEPYVDEVRFQRSLIAVPSGPRAPAYG